MAFFASAPFSSLLSPKGSKLPALTGASTFEAATDGGEEDPDEAPPDAPGEPGWWPDRWLSDQPATPAAARTATITAATMALARGERRAGGRWPSSAKVRPP